MKRIYVEVSDMDSNMTAQDSFEFDETSSEDLETVFGGIRRAIGWDPNKQIGLRPTIPIDPLLRYSFARWEPKKFIDLTAI